MKVNHLMNLMKQTTRNIKMNGLDVDIEIMISVFMWMPLVVMLCAVLYQLFNNGGS
jgi:hypothetical protein